MIISGQQIIKELKKREHLFHRFLPQSTTDEMKKTVRADLQASSHDSTNPLKEYKLFNFPSTKILITELIDDSVIKKKYKIFQRYIGDYIKKVIGSLSTKGPSKGILFTKKNRDKLFEVFEMDENFIYKVKEKVSKEILNEKNKFLNDTFNIYLAALISHCEINKKTYGSFSGDLLFYFILRSYSILLIKYFPHKPDEKLMKYTIENVLTQRYIIKKFNNMREYLDYFKYSFFSNDEMIKRFLTGQDRYIVYSLQHIHNKLNSSLKKIVDEFLKVHENFKESKLTASQFKVNSEGDEYIEDIPSISESLTKIIIKLSNSFFIEKEPNPHILASITKFHTTYKNNKTNENEFNKKEYDKYLYVFRLLLINMKKTENSEKDIMNKIFKPLVANYLVNANSSDLSNKKKFLNFSVKSYGASNTKNQYIIFLKNILNEYLNEQSHILEQNHMISRIKKIRNMLYFYFVFYTINKS